MTELVGIASLTKEMHNFAGLVDSVRLKTGQENDTKHFSEDKVDEKPSSK